MPFLVLIMAIQLRLYNFAKKENSTAHPAGTAAYENYMCNLKDTTSILHPTFLLRPTSQNWNPAQWTYAYVNLWHKYYFVDDVEWVSPYWELHLSIDALATYKTEILASTRYVLRSASDYDPTAIDTAYSPTTRTTTLRSTWNWPGFSWDPNNGSFVLGIVSDSDASINGVVYYVLNTTQLHQLLGYMYDNILHMEWNDVSSWNAVISKAFVDPMDYIVSAVWFPYQIGTAGPQRYIKFGFWNTQVAAYTIAGIVDNISYALTNPVNPYQVRGEWQLLAPFTKYEVIYNPFGVIPLNPVLCHKYGGIRFTLRVDVLTGVGVLSIRGYTSDIAIDSPLINQQTALVGLPIPIGRQRDNLLSVFSDVGLMAAGAGAAAAADTTASSIAAISSMASASVRFTGDLLSQNAAFIGKSSSVAGNSTQLVYQVTYTDPQTENNDDLGRPLCEARLLSTLSGFTVCADGEIDNVGMLAEERELINKYLTTGFYIA